MKINIAFEVLKNGKFTKVSQKKAIALLDSGKYYQANEIHLGELRFLTNNETFIITLEPMDEFEDDELIGDE